MFGISLLLLGLLTIFEDAFTSMTSGAERLLTFLFLVLPAGLGAIFGVMSLIHRQGRTWLAIAGILLNMLFALFHLMLVLFAG